MRGRWIYKKALGDFCTRVSATVAEADQAGRSVETETGLVAMGSSEEEAADSARVV